MKFYSPNDDRSLFTRLTKTILVPISSIQVDDFVQDDHFLKLYQSWLLGKVDGWVTRIQIDHIVSGHFVRISDGSIQHIEPTPISRPEHINTIVQRIRIGSRPRLVLYSGYLPGTQDKLICCDDAVSFEAYRKLGITSLPALILGRPNIKVLSESSIILRIRQDSSIARFSAQAFKRTAYHSTIGDEDSISGMSPTRALEILKTETEKTLEAIKEFHNLSQTSSPINYHHTLYSVTLRTLEAIKAIELLLEKNLYRQIRPIIRSTYEAFLNFYVDWLDPEYIGPILQLASNISRVTDKTEAKKLRRMAETRFGGVFRLCETTSQKGRLSPLGEAFHDYFYAALSPLVHQDFGATIEYGKSLETGETPDDDADDIMSLIRTLDLIVAALVVRILDDEGKAEKIDK